MSVEWNCVCVCEDRWGIYLVSVEWNAVYLCEYKWDIYLMCVKWNAVYILQYRADCVYEGQEALRVVEPVEEQQKQSRTGGNNGY